MKKKPTLVFIKNIYYFWFLIRPLQKMQHESQHDFFYVTEQIFWAPGESRRGFSLEVKRKSKL